MTLELPAPTQVPTLADMVQTVNRIHNQFLQNKNQEIQNQFASPLDQAKLALLNAQAPNILANTQRTEESTKLLPKQMQIALQNAATRQKMVEQSMNRFGSPLYNLKQAAQTFGKPFVDSQTTLNPKSAAQIYQSAINQASGLPVNSNNIGQQNSVIPSKVTPEQVMAAKQAAQNAYIKETTPSQILGQRYYAHTAGNTFNLQNEFLPQVSKFATLPGYANKSMDKLMSSLGQNNPNYLTYLKYKQSVPIMVNELRRVLGGAASDKETSLLNSVVNQNLGSLTPSQFIKLHNSLGNLLNTISTPLSMDNRQAARGLGKEAKILTINNNSYVKIKGPDGRIYNIPSSEVSDAIKAGGQQIG